MPKFDSNSLVEIQPAYVGPSLAASASGTTPTVDLLNYRGATLFVNELNLFGVFQVGLEHSDDGVSWESVPVNQIINTVDSAAPGPVYTMVLGQGISNLVYLNKLGYLGSKRYIRAIYLNDSNPRFIWMVFVLSRPVESKPVE